MKQLVLRGGCHAPCRCWPISRGQRLYGADSSTLPFDLLSIDTGPVAAAAQLPGSAEFCLAVLPTMPIKYRAAVEGCSQLRLSLLDSGDLPRAARRQALHLLQQRGIRWLEDSRVEAVRRDHLC